MTTKKKANRIVALFLAVVMTLSGLPLVSNVLPKADAAVTRDGEERTVVIAASDYQYCNSSGDNGGSGGSYDVYGVGAYGNEGSKRVVQRILGVMADQNGITSADGFLFCGDYDYDLTQSASNTSSGLDSLKQAVSGVITSTPDNSVFVQGNHDSGIATAGMSSSGNNDPSTGKYGVFVINEDDYPWQGSSGTAEETVKQTAQNLRDYLNSKIAVNYTAPIFVVSHLPLHYSMRSKRDGDNKYANYIFDVLNEAGEQGLNIIYMFGHNHSHGWDDYLGGAQVFLTKGDKLNVAQKSQTVYNEETLNFTYMNAGYTGYYQNTNNNAPSTDLTMTSFEIGDDDVIINRYSFLSQNVTSLKVAGRLNTESSYNTNEGSQTAANTGSRFSANTKTYSSPYTLTLSEVTDTEHEIDRIIPLASSSSASDADGRIYAKVNSVGELTSGGTYLLIEQGSSFLTSTLNGEGDRGFVLQGTNGLSLSDTITGDYTAYEWQMDSVNGKWTFLSDNGYLKLNKDGSWWDAALVQSGASAFTVSKGNNGFTFRTTDGTNSADLNNHGTNHGIGGWDGNPTPFVIYRLVHAADEEYVSSSSAFTLYTPHTSGQILEEGDYIFYGAAKGTVLTSADHGTKGLAGSTDYIITDDIIKSDAACVVSVRVADAGSNTYYLMVGDRYISFNSDDIELTSTRTEFKVITDSSYPGVVAFSNTAGNMNINTYNNGQWAGWNGGINDPNDRITLYKNTACVDNGTWVPVHESTITTPDITTYSLPGDGKYALVGSNGILNASTSGTSQNPSVTGKPSGEQTIWELKSEAGGYTLKTTINGTPYYLNNNGGVSTTEQYVTLNANASSKVTIGSLGDNFSFYPATVTETAATTQYKYTLDTNGVDANGRYLIVAPSDAVALVLLGDNYAISKKDVVISTANRANDTILIESDAYDWFFNKTTGGSIKWNAANNRYLRSDADTITTRSRSSNWTIISSNDGTYKLYNLSSKYLRYYNSAFEYNSSTTSNKVRLYKYDGTVSIPGTVSYTYSDAWTTTGITTPASTTIQTDQWAMLEPSYAIKVGLDTPVSTLKEAILASAEFKAHLGYSSTGADAVALPEGGITFDTSKYNGTKLGYYEVPVYYNGINIGFVVAQVVADRKIVSLAIDKMEGSVLVGASKGANTGANFIATYEDGSTGTIPITVGMLIDYTGNFRCADLYCKTVGDYPELGVYYKDNWFSGFTLHVLERDNYPEYPDEGSIKVDKKGWANNFAANGVAQVELTATGVPMDPGIDIVIILDTSSSMSFEMGKYNGQDVFGDGAGKWFDVDGNELSGVTDSNVTDKITRLNVMKESLSALLEGLNVIGANGKTRDINVAIADFNGYTLNKTQGNQATDRLTEVNQAGTDSDRSVVFTGSRQLDAGAFVQASELAASGFRVDDIVGRSGTNYDRAMEEAYQLLAAKKARNDANQENRNLFCIFMSDGAPFQYNYFGGQSSPETGNTWNDWVTGKYADISGFNVPENAHTYFYNGLENRHRMAEAIKGSPEQTYTVIRPDDTVSANGQQFMQKVDGIGAKLYSIGFCLTPDKGIRIDTMDTVLTRMATSPEFYYPANSATQLNAAFNSILNDLKQAATEAYFVDNMGAAYDLQMASEYSKNGRNYVLDPAPVIEVKSYEVYTHMDVVNGVINDENRIGERKGTYDLLERVSFNSSGAEAYSDQKAAGENIFVNGLINAKCFIYNTKNEAVMIDTNDDGELDYSLAPETFYWKIGIVAETEFSLSYYVYLTGSMEGTREAGSYPTNEAAVLYYMNYLDVPCEKPTVSPKLPWLAANVSYEFYLVNTDGQPVNSSGVVVPFANRVLIGNIQSKEVLLNNTDTTEAFIAANLELPEGYTLYSEDAKYTIVIDSETELSTAEIYDNVKIKNRNTVTTYFYDEKGNYNTAGYVPNVSDYGNTHVAFGVLLVPSLIPDAVVIDYGIPVNVSVLANDLSIAAGTEINAIAKNIAPDTVLNKQGYDESRMTGSKELTLKNGTATLSGGSVCYTPTDALMSEQEIFYYEVILGGKYYYSTVTVYPAQNIYYEDSFFTFTPADAWEQVGTRKDAAQAEDRPGTFNLSKIDFNNVYGYDQAYEDADAITYSLGAAYKATVSAATPSAGASPNVDGNAPLAYFTFAGTGFDLFSVTSSTTGAAMVQVYNASGTRVQNRFVQTYYGFTYDEENDEFVPAEDAEDGLYQVPVIRIRDMAYGVYTVYVTPYYLAAFDFTGNEAFDFYVDGVRIYDPAGTADSLSESIQAVYNADKEYNDTFVELRSNIISESSFYKLIDKTLENAAIDNFAPGAMYIDGINALSGEVSGAYGKFSTAGPNNELYLTKGQAVAFYLQIDGSGKAPASVQLGMKVVGGTSAKGSLLVMNSAQDKPFTVAVNGAAPRYKDITNAITWDPSLSAGTSVTGFAMADASAFIKAPGGDMSAYEWTIVSSGKNRMLGNGTNFATLTPTENSGVAAGFAPNGTGDLFSFSGANGVFTIRDESKGLSLYSANGTLITGSAISEDTYALYKKTTDETDGTAGYEKVMNASEIEAGTYVIVSLADGGKFLRPECETVTNAEGTYRTLYPIVVINNSDNIISLTNFKFAFTKDEAEAEPVAKLMSSAPARTFAMRAVKSFVVDGYVEEPEIDLSDVFVEWANDEPALGETAALYVRTPDDIAAVTVGNTVITDFTDNGDGTRTFTYSFTVEADSDGSLSIVLRDAFGNVSETFSPGELKLPEPVEEETTLPTGENPTLPDDQPDDGGKHSNWLLDLLRRIIEFFKSIIRWWKSLI